MRCHRCGKRWYYRDEDGDVYCIICARPRVVREHEQPRRDAPYILDRYVRLAAIDETLGMEVQ
jgi:hypothetical protein